MKYIEYLVIGSGCSAAMAAQTLVEAGAEVTMVDVGMANPIYDSQVPADTFIEIRKHDPDQYRYLLGEKAEGAAWGEVGKGAQITPTRKHMLAGVDTYIPLDSTTFSPVESLGYGGLGIGWGLQCWEYSKSDIQAAGLDQQRMAEAYETVSKRIGISATKDDAAPYTIGTLKSFQPSPMMDRNHRLIYQKYLQHKARLDHDGLSLGRTPLALLTKDLNGRKQYQYRDLDFYTDSDQSAWRPWITVNSLRKKPNFTYLGGHLVVRFSEKKEYVEVTCLTVPGNEIVTLRCRMLISGAGALGSARIALRSQAENTVRLPLLCNPYTFVPCLQPAMMGKAVEPKKLGFAQLSLFLDEGRRHFDVSLGSLYSYQSLMLFRTINQIPFLGFRDARKVLQYMVSGLVIMVVHHPDRLSDKKYLTLVKSSTAPTGDRLRASYALDDEEQATFTRREKKLVNAVRTLGLYAAKRINPGHGASIHYGGTLPFSDTEKPLALSPSGRLHGSKRVYFADSSGFTYLPAQGLTFTLLANAHITAQKVLQHEQ